MSKIFAFIGFISIFSLKVSASDEFCGKPSAAMQVCVQADRITGRFVIQWLDPQDGTTQLPVISRVESPLDGSITYSGYLNSTYPFQSYTLVVKVKEASAQGIPAVFSYAKTFIRTEVYTFNMVALN
jgi:hypothetical protein